MAYFFLTSQPTITPIMGATMPAPATQGKERGTLITSQSIDSYKYSFLYKPILRRIEIEEKKTL